VGRGRGRRIARTPHRIKVYVGGDKNVQEETRSKEEERRKERGMVG
jgi:hypothetical protein